MEEHQITPLTGKPEHGGTAVIATQNPVETTGTFPLPEARMDRFYACMGLLTKAEGAGNSGAI